MFNLGSKGGQGVGNVQAALTAAQQLLQPIINALDWNVGAVLMSMGVSATAAKNYSPLALPDVQTLTAPTGGGAQPVTVNYKKTLGRAALWPLITNLGTEAVPVTLFTYDLTTGQVTDSTPTFVIPVGDKYQHRGMLDGFTFGPGTTVAANIQVIAS